MTNLRLQAINGKDQPTLGIEPGAPLGRVAHRQRHQFVIAFQQILDVPLTDRHLAGPQGRVNLRGARAGLVAMRPNKRHHVQPIFIMRQDQVSFFQWVYRPMVTGASRILTAPHRHLQAPQPLPRRHLAPMGVADPQGLSAFGRTFPAIFI